MVRYPTIADGADDAPPSAAWLFAQALLGKPIPDPAAKRKQARAERERLEWLAQISTEHEAKLRKLQSAEAEARHQRELLEWLAQISTEHAAKLRRLKAEEYEAQEAQQRWKQYYEDYSAPITEWNEVDHPRRGYGPHPGAWVGKGGAGGSSAGQSPTFLDAVIRRNQAIADLTGVVTPGMLRSTRLASAIQSAARLTADVTAAAAAGLGTGVKANVNGFATAVKDAATLGLNPGQLELIGVTKEDRDRGYDMAAAISTASGQILLAVGTGAISSALSKGGTIARTANKALVVYDTAGNAVGVVQGVYDASQNKLSIANGAQIAGGLLGLAANVVAAKGVTKLPTASQAPQKAATTVFSVGKHGEMPTPRPGQHSHHGVMSAWMERMYPDYNPDKAPSILMPTANHRATMGVYNKWRAEMARKQGGAFDWNKVSEADARALSETMFDAAEVPVSVRNEYWAEFERMKAKLQQQRVTESVEEGKWNVDLRY